MREINGISNEMVNETEEVAIKPTTSVLQYIILVGNNYMLTGAISVIIYI